MADASPGRSPVSMVPPEGASLPQPEQSCASPASTVQLQRTGLTYRVTCGGVSTFISPMGRALRSYGPVAPVEAAPPEQEPPTSSDP
jgi:hypothetical protein